MLTVKLVTADQKPIMMIRGVIGYRIVGNNFHPGLSFYTAMQEVTPPKDFYIPIIKFPEVITSMEHCIMNEYDEIREIELEKLI